MCRSRGTPFSHSRVFHDDSGLDCACSARNRLMCGCTRGDADEPAQTGNAANGRHLLYSYGCGSCHVISGVGEADGAVGPPLRGFGNRLYIAGVMVNAPENLSRWIAQPQGVQPRNAMPDSGVTQEQARDMATYLYTLR